MRVLYMPFAAHRLIIHLDSASLFLSTLFHLLIRSPIQEFHLCRNPVHAAEAQYFRKDCGLQEDDSFEKLLLLSFLNKVFFFF